MSDLIGIIAPIFALIAFGAVANGRRLIEPAALRGITDLVFYAGLPALLFVSIVDAPELRLADVATAFLAAAVAVFGMGLLFGRTVLRANLARATVFAINGCYGNTVMLGIPIVSAAYGQAGLALLLAIIAFHSAVLLPLATLLISSEGGSESRFWTTLRDVVPTALRNPIIASLMLALVWRLTGLALPLPLHRLLSLIAPAGPVLALFCLGASLPKPAGIAGLPEMIAATVLKLAILPGVAALSALALGVDGLAFKVVVVAAALPTGANAFLLARRSETMAEASAGTVVLSTILSLGTLAGLLRWLGP